jgi:DNA polymerase III alpha subunit
MTPRARKGNAHLTLLAADNAGYANLIKLSARRLPRGCYYKRASTGAARAAQASVIALSGASGRVYQGSENRPNDARAETDRLSGSSAPTTSTPRSCGAARAGASILLTRRAP